MIGMSNKKYYFYINYFFVILLTNNKSVIGVIYWGREKGESA